MSKNGIQCQHANAVANDTELTQHRDVARHSHMFWTTALKLRQETGVCVLNVADGTQRAGAVDIKLVTVDNFGDNNTPPPKRAKHG